MEKFRHPKVLLILAVCFVVFIGFFAYVFIRLPYGSAEISGNIVENNYNNLLAGGGLLRVEDTLYFNYRGNDFCYGLIEISRTGSRRLLWNGIRFGAGSLTSRIYKHNNQLYMLTDGNIQTLSGKDDTFHVQKQISSLNSSIYFQEVDGKFIYLVSADGAKGTELFLSSGAVVAKIADDVVCFYVIENDIFYCTSSKSRTIFRKYNLDDRSNVLLYTLEEFANLYYFIIEQDYFVFCATSEKQPNYSIYKIPTDGTASDPELILSGNDSVSDYRFDIGCINAYNGTIYCSSHRGITAHHLKTQETITICDSYAEDIYIVDDTWVYFVNNEGDLHRVTQDGKIQERIFGS